jgi:hypothetical protein
MRNRRPTRNGDQGYPPISGTLCCATTLIELGIMRRLDEVECVCVLYYQSFIEVYGGEEGIRYVRLSPIIWQTVF